MDEAVPVFAPVDNNQNLLRQLLCLGQREDFEKLVERAKAARKNHQRLRKICKPELPHEEVMELQIQRRGDVRVGILLERQTDVQTYCLRARLARSAISGFHDSGSAAGGHHKT